MTGYVSGNLTDADGADELLATAEQSIPVAARLGIPRLNLHGTGLDGRGLPVQPVEVVTGPMWLRGRSETLARIAALGERAGRHLLPGEPQHRRRPPRHPVRAGPPTPSRWSRPSTTRTCRLMLDLYHAQIGEGNLIELIRRCGPTIGEIQVADVPGRCEPGTGEINYPAIARALRRDRLHRHRRARGLGLRRQRTRAPAGSARPSPS